MKNRIKTLLSTAYLCLALLKIDAQTAEGPVAYMSSVSQSYNDINKAYLSYTSAVAHGKSARKVEKRRQKLLSLVDQSWHSAAGLPAYKGNTAYRDSSIAYQKILYAILNDDYSKIVNMEEISEQSYDNMEAYLLMQDKAQEKQHQAFEQVRTAERKFAKDNQVTLIETKSKLDLKIEEASKVNDYSHRVYLIFFKSYKQESYLMDAIKNKNLSAIEQNNNTLIKTATVGLAKLDTMQAFEGDNSDINACRDALAFYKDETTKTPVFVDYFLKDDNFQKIKSAYDARTRSEKTQKVVDEYNKSVQSLNDAVSSSNAATDALNDRRSHVLDQWNRSSQRFLDAHVPYYN